MVLQRRLSMLNNRKIRLMTQLAIYEKNAGREDLKLAKYYKSDYARLQVLKTAVFVTLSYIITVVFVLLYQMEYLLDNALTYDWKGLGMKVLGFYIAVMSVYLICTLLGYSIKYTISRKKLGKYFRMLRKLKEIYDKEDEYANKALQEGEEEA